MRIGVTGPRGFTASRLIPRLVEAGHDVVGISRPPRGDAYHDPQWRIADVSDASSVVGAFDGLDVVFHLAGIAHAPNILGELLRSGTKRAVFVGSTGIYTRLHSPDADLKRTAEGAIMRAPLDWTVIRPTMIYGTGRDRNMIRLLRWLRRVPVFPAPGGASTLQQPVHVDDLCSALLACLDGSASVRQVYDIGGPTPIPLSMVIGDAGKALGRRTFTLPIPTRPAYHAVRGLRAVGLPCPVWPEQILRLKEHKSVSIESAVRDLGFMPRSFAVGIRDEVLLLRSGSDHAGH